MAKFDKRLDALQLRRKGKSINEIAQCLGVSKSTVSRWCRNIKLTKSQRSFIEKKMRDAGHAGRIKGALKNKAGKENRVASALDQAQKTLGKLSKRDRFLLGIGLYWGEGVKADQSTTAFVNSDPRAVEFMKRWFMEHLHVSTDRFNPYIFITLAHQPRETDIKAYWSKMIHLPVNQFRKVIYIRSTQKKVYENNDLYYGTVALRIRRSTDLKYLIRGLIQYAE